MNRICSVTFYNKGKISRVMELKKSLGLRAKDKNFRSVGVQQHILESDMVLVLLH